MAECDPNNVNCANPACRSKCGWIQWFGNLSDCTVILQYQLTSGGVWHSLGEYGPSQSTELNGGILMLPQEVNLRAIRKPQPGDTGPPEVVSNWGRLGTSLQSLYVGDDKCRGPGASAAQEVLRSLGRAPEEPALKPIHTMLIVLVGVFAAAALGAAMVTALKARKK